MTEQKRTKTTLYFPADLWKRVKIEAINRDCDATEIVATAVAEWLAKNAKKGGS